MNFKTAHKLEIFIILLITRLFKFKVRITR